MKYFDKINLSNKRSENETFDQYKERLKKNKIKVKMHLQGDQVWDSRNNGTYIKSKHGII